MDAGYNKIAVKLEQLGKEGSDQHKVLNDRMTRMEKWMWMLIGGGIVVGAIFSNINFPAIFGQ
jgi:hypothetical protein